MRASASVLAVILVLCVTLCHAQLPRTLSYQGVLTDTAGTPKPDANYSFTFRIYTAGTGGSAIWSETRSLQTNHGLFSTILGGITPLPDTLKFDRQCWLGIQIASEAELLPRIRLTSVGSSISAAQADIAQTVPNHSLNEGKIADGQVVKSVNGVKDRITLIGAGGTSVTTLADTITISGSGGGGISSLENTDTTLRAWDSSRAFRAARLAVSAWMLLPPLAKAK